MLNCEEARRIIHLYLDGELPGVEVARFEAHVASCERCQSWLALEKEWISVLRSKAPLYKAPEELRHSLSCLVRAKGGENNYTAPELLKRRINRLVQSQIFFSRLRTVRIKAAVAIIAITLAGVIFWSLVNQITEQNSESPSRFAMMSVNNHLRRQHGQLPLEITTDSAKAVMDWFSGKLMFNLKLPNYDAPSNHPKPYTLEGARLVGYEQDYAAYVAYQMQGKLISLIATSSSVALPSGGEIISSQGIPFHFETINGYKVITWTENGLTYSLVSDLAERGQESCIVCHQDKQQQITKPFHK
jgi:anti-sigma factor (TIGR02949 family)